jgi:hypothetical protein
MPLLIMQKRMLPDAAGSVSRYIFLQAHTVSNITVSMETNSFFRFPLSACLPNYHPKLLLRLMSDFGFRLMGRSVPT